MSQDSFFPLSQDTFLQIFIKHSLYFLFFDTAVNNTEKFPVLNDTYILVG